MTRILGCISSIKLSVNSQDVFSLTHPFQPLPFCVFQAPSCELGEGGLPLSLGLQHQGLALLLQVSEWTI